MMRVYPPLRFHCKDQVYLQKGCVIFFSLAVAAFLAVRLWGITTYPMDVDELFSLGATRMGIWSLFSYVAADIVHPPLFYLLLKGWVWLGGESLFWLRLFPLLWAVASLVPFLLLCRELNLRARETTLALLLLGLNGLQIYYAAVLRMYTMFSCLTVAAVWLFALLWNRKTSVRESVALVVGGERRSSSFYATCFFNEV